VNPNEWQIVGVAAAISTAAATVLSLGLSLLWRTVDRKRASWVAYDTRSNWGTGYHGAPQAEFELANAGDGTAFAVRSDGLGCRVRLQGEWTKVNRPGSGGGSQSMEDESYGSTEEVSRRVA